MQIGHGILSSYDKNIQESVRMEYNNTMEQSGQVKSSNELAGLKEGAVFKGEVLDILGDKVTIALENETQIMARLQGEVELGVGDRLFFSVKENNASQILIKPMFESLYSAQTQVLEKALDAAGLSPTEKNFSAAKELMDAGMPVDKGNLVKLLSQSMKFEGTSMQTLTALNKMNIPVNEADIAQYERYQNVNHQLTGDIGQAVESMTSFTAAFPEGTDGSMLLNVAGELLDIFMQAGEQSEGAQDIVAMQQDAGLAGQESVQNQEMVQSPELMQKEGTIAGQELISAKDGEMAGTIGKLTDTTGIIQAEDAPNQEGKVVLQNETTLAKAANEASKDSSVQAETVSFTKETLSNLSGLLEQAGVSSEQTQSILQQSNSPEQLLQHMLQALSVSGANEGDVRKLFDSKEFKDLFAEVIQKSWSINPKNMKDPKEIEELYNRILKQSREFEQTIATKGSDTKDFQQNFQNMRQNMQFMEQLNNQMFYAQMPLKLSNQNANSELYVYADKRKLMEKKDGISVMLHLDMDHLGMTDIKVTLTGANVNARFYLNDQESVDIVADNMDQLAKQLADRGFSLTNEVIKRQPQESINKVVDEIIDENAERSIKRYTFDART